MNKRHWLNFFIVCLLLITLLPPNAPSAVQAAPISNWQEVLTADYGFAQDLQVYQGKLYALISSGYIEYSGARLYVSNDGVNWNTVSGFPTEINLATNLYVYNNRLYIGAATGSYSAIYYYNGTSFVADFTDTYAGGYPGIKSFVEHQGALYAMYGHEGRVFKRMADGNWQLVGDVPTCGGRDLESYGGALYMGVGYSPTGCPTQLWRDDGSGWQLLEDYNDLTGDAVNALAVYAGKLYVATAYTDRPHYVFEYTQTPTGVVKTNSWLMNTSGDFAPVKSELWIGSAWGLHKKVGNPDWVFTSDSVAPNVFEYFNGYVYGGVSASDYGRARVHRQPYAYAGPTFVNVAPQLGVANGFHILSAQWTDIDGDGDLDLFAAGGNRTRHYLYENRVNQGQGFVDVTAAWGLSTADLSAWAVGIFGDYDRDGRPDLWLGQSEKLSTLYHNEGNSFRDVTDEVNLGSVRQITALAGGAAWIDYDNDGDLDLFTSEGVENYHPHIFRNDNPNGFTQVDLGIEFYSCSAAWGDYDNDGDLDLAAGLLDHFYRNDVKTTGRFTQLPDLLPVSPANPNATGGYGGMWGDYNNDGFLDLYIGGQTPTYLFHNNGDGTFTDVTAAAGLTLPLPPGDYDWAHAGSWVDFDNDGDLDLHVSTYYGRADLFYRNDGGVFTEIGTDIGLRDNASSVEGSWGDFDGDGDLDFYAANWASGGPRLWRNDGGNSRNWLNVKLVGQISNRDGVGARVTIANSQGTQMRELNSSGDLSENPLSLWFGLGTQTTVDTLTVRWPSGIVQTLHNVPANQTLTVTETVSVGTLFFGKKRVGGDYDLWQAIPQPGSANPQPVTVIPGNETFPVVSPDGRFIIYTEGWQAGLWILNRVTGDTHLLLENASPLAWHPTESRFLYQTDAPCSEGLYEAVLSGTTLVSTRPIFDPDLPVQQAHYSPDGQRIVFTYDIGACWYDNKEIAIAPLTGTVPLQESDLVRITTNNAHDYQPHWTPNGNEIVWLRANRQVCRMNADGSVSEQCFSIPAADVNLFYLTTPPSGYQGPYLAAIYNHGNPKDIGLVKADGNVDWLQIPDIERIDGLDWFAVNNSGKLHLSKSVSAPTAQPGDVLTYTLVLSATGNTATAMLTDTLPAGLTYVPGSVTGGATYANGEIHYTGSVAPGSDVVITYQAQVNVDVLPGSILNNTAVVTGAGQWLERSAAVAIPNPGANKTLFLLYLEGDGNLGDEMLTLLNEAESALATNPNVDIWAVLDGPSSNDSYLYHLQPDANPACPNYVNPTCNGVYTLGQNIGPGVRRQAASTPCMSS